MLHEASAQQASSPLVSILFRIFTGPPPVGVIRPGPDHDLSLFQAVEDLPLQALVPEFCSERPASLQASARLFPCAICTAIWRSLTTLCSGLTVRPLGILGASGSS